MNVYSVIFSGPRCRNGLVCITSVLIKLSSIYYSNDCELSHSTLRSIKFNIRGILRQKNAINGLFTAFSRYAPASPQTRCYRNER